MTAHFGPYGFAKTPNFREGEPMWDSCAVDVRIHLPRGVVAELEEVQRRDPEILSRIVLYGLTRRAIFEHLAERGAQEREEG